MNPFLHRICRIISTATDESKTISEIRRLASQITSVDVADINHALDLLAASNTAKTRQKDPVCEVLGVLCAKHNANESSAESLRTGAIVTLYEMLDGVDPACGYLLTLLAVDQSADSIRVLANLLSTTPPNSSQQIIPSISILMRRPGPNILKLFPKVLDGLQFRSVAGPILDLANFLFRTGQVSEHPAGDRVDQLTRLLGVFAGKLGEHEDTIQNGANPTPGDARAVSDSISVVVSLCDALALMEAKGAIGKLFQVLELSHRRLRTEAAAALAKLGEVEGQTALIEMAEHPVTRLRVLAYAGELGLLDNIPDELKTDVARAEAELTLVLSDPMYFGFAPASCELVGQCNQFWPGYDEPVDCFLFRYTYPLEHGELQNVGIVGPLTHCISANVNHLPPEDIYAAYAGWHVQHEDIVTIEINTENQLQQIEVEKRIRQISDAGFETVIPVFIGSLFGERSLIAKARKDNRFGAIVAAPAEIEWFEGLVPETSFDIHVGRRLLRSFN
jgi:hypothetical protein